MIPGLQRLAAKHRHRTGALVPVIGRAALLLPLILLGCSGVALPKEDVPPSGSDPAFHKMIADNLKDTFKEVAKYDEFEISDPRWVHTVKGWSWLTCVRFQDREHRRSYALFIKGNEVIDSRYAVEADGCDTAAYIPFDLMPSAPRPANGTELEPLH
jgi:hypothetical protein